jgi:hypothetical protein
MTINNLLSTLDTTRCTRLIVVPTTRDVLGQLPMAGRFISIGVTDWEKIDKIKDLTIDKLYVMGEQLTVEI